MLVIDSLRKSKEKHWIIICLKAEVDIPSFMHALPIIT